MRFVSAIRVLLVLLVAALMPLESARCVCAGMMAAEKAPVAERGQAHACCAAKAAKAAAAAAAEAPARSGCDSPVSSHSCNSGHCSCSLTTAESPAPLAIAPAPESESFAPVAILAVASLFAPDAPIVSADPAPDVGGPSVPAPACAHGLRAPPAIA